MRSAESRRDDWIVPASSPLTGNWRRQKQQKKRQKKQSRLCCDRGRAITRIAPAFFGEAATSPLSGRRRGEGGEKWGLAPWRNYRVVERSAVARDPGATLSTVVQGACPHFPVAGTDSKPETGKGGRSRRSGLDAQLQVQAEGLPRLQPGAKPQVWEWKEAGALQGLQNIPLLMCQLRWISGTPSEFLVVAAKTWGFAPGCNLEPRWGSSRLTPRHGTGEYKIRPYIAVIE